MTTQTPTLTAQISGAQISELILTLDMIKEAIDTLNEKQDEILEKLQNMTLDSTGYGLIDE